MKLDRFFFNKKATEVAENILGCYLVNESNEGKVVGKIVETEAYEGEDDLACHASKGKTKRTEIMYGKPGRLYIYLNYGIFFLTNIVCDRKNYPAAILLRAAEIVEGKDIAKKRIYKSKFVKANNFLSTGPGKLSIAFGLDKEKNNLDLTNSKNFYIEKDKKTPAKSDIIKAKRVGIDYAKHCKHYLWRFYLKDNKFVSKL